MSSPIADPPWLVEQRERRDALMRELETAPVAVVRGVVSEKGVGASKLRGDTQWTITLVLERWRVGAGPVRETPLVLHELGDDGRLQALRDATQPYTVLELAARVVERAGERPEALIESVDGVVVDAELAALATTLQETVTYADAVLGTLTLDRRLDWYTGRARWAGAEIEVSIDGKSRDALERATAVAHTLWRDEATWNERIRAFVVAELLELKNDAWLDDDEKPLDADELLERIELDSVTVYPDGRFEFWFDDGDVFWGHSIQVRCDLESGPREAALAG